MILRPLELLRTPAVPCRAPSPPCGGSTLPGQTIRYPKDPWDTLWHPEADCLIAKVDGPG